MNKSPYNFSNLNREDRIKDCLQSHFDLIIIGGGITGAGIAFDAGQRGLKCLLLEKNDFASGTSSKSTKLIHGGLRYLKQFEFSLVKESGLERAIAHNNICHLVHPENMFLPIVKNGSFNKLSANLAISFYDWLAKVPKKDRKKSLNKSEVLDLEPLIRKDIIKSGIIYSEYRTDDARLTIELIKAARKNSVEAFNYTEANSYIYSNGKICGVKCFDQILEKEILFKGDVIVNSTGPWVDDVRKIDQANTETNLHLTKGVHIVFDKKNIPLNNATYFDAFDGRMIFAIPRENNVYVGTTDTNYDGDKDKLYCSQEDAQYLLKAINNFFNIETLNINDIKTTWSGLRPLIHKPGKPSTELSRKDEVFISKSGLISIAGGKLTGFRKMAERVVDLVYEKLNKTFIDSNTETTKIHNNPFSDYSEFLNFCEELKQEYSEFKIPNEVVSNLISTFGKDAQLIFENAELILNDKDSKNIERLIKSQVLYSIKYESVFHPMDFLDRRSSWLNFRVNTLKENLNFIVDIFSDELNIPDDKKKEYFSECQDIIKTNTLEDLKKKNQV